MYYAYIQPSWYWDDCLYHHGIKGQRWGIRRYQNPDGTLTAAGRKKYGSDDYREVKSLQKKSIKELSNDELEKIARRKELEKKVKQKGNEETKRILIENGTKILTTAAVIGAAYIGGRYVVNHLPELSSTIASSVAKASIGASKSVVKEVAKEGHNIRKAAASTKAARNYVKAVNRFLRK